MEEPVAKTEVGDDTVGETPQPKDVGQDQPRRDAAKEAGIQPYAQMNPYGQNENRASVAECEKNKYESDQNSESALTAEQTEK